MASYCCFRRQRKTIRFPREIPWPWGQGQVSKQLISFQDMLGLLVRPDVGVIVIQGIGGSGKTWAANAAYRAARTSNLFQEYVWVPLSMNCTMGQCINKIATSLSCNQGDFRQECNKGDNFSIERAKAMIKEYLTKRKFLLVLDNVYFTEESILECLGVPRPQQQSLGSKIFVTTRTVRGKSIMEPDIVLRPLPLTYEDSHDLLREKIGKDTSFEHDLIGYFFGMPLTVVLLAGVLCDAPTQEAFSELVTKAYYARGAYLSEFDTLERMVKFAYHQLPSNNVRHCLLYCLLFPEHQGISVKELIWYWIMDGLFQKNIGFDEANHIGKEILDVLIKRGMVYLDDNGHVRMHDVVRETVSRYGKGNGYKEQHEWHVSNPIIRLEHLAKYSRRVLLMDTEMECLYGSPRCSFISSLHLRGNYLLKAISEEFFRHMGQLEILDLSFTLIQVLPRSISFLTRLRMLLLIGCDYLKEIQHISPLVQLEILDASGCGSLKSVGSGSFDHMALLKLLDLSATSITFLTSIPVSMELRHLNLQGCPFLRSELPYGVSKSGAVRNMQLGNVEDLADWMDMLWLPSGLTFNLSDKHGLEVSLDANMGVNTYVYASDAYFFNCLKKDSPLWLNCFRKFQIVISCSTGNQTMDTDVQAMKTDSIFQNSYFRTKRFSHFIEPNRYLEINGTVGVPYDLDGILGHAELISLKRLAVTTQLSDLNISRLEAARELWVENCDHLESFLTADVIQALSAMGSLHNLWISNMESLSYFCKGVEDVTSFSCLKHLFFDCCPNIICLFPSVLHFPNLETLNIKFCDILERVFGSSALGEDTLPRLQSLQLWELPELTSVCTGVLPSLKNLKVRGCAKLRKIPVGVNENSPFVTTIGEQLWWDSLIWDDETIKRWLLFRNWRPLLPHIATEG